MEDLLVLEQARDAFAKLLRKAEGVIRELVEAEVTSGVKQACAVQKSHPLGMSLKQLVNAEVERVVAPIRERMDVATVSSYEDCLLQPLSLPTKSPIRVVMQNGRVELRIGPHEWAWDMRTGELTERHILNLGHFPP